MIIGLTGFHGTGKSALSHFLSKKFGWSLIHKRHTLMEWSGFSNYNDSIEWYRNLYREIGPYKIMRMFLERIGYQKNPESIKILDAIHSSEEWRAVKEVDANCLLAGIFIPKELSQKRISAHGLELNLKREKYWHDGSACLLSQIEWTFCGTANDELRLLESQALIESLKATGRII